MCFVTFKVLHDFFSYFVLFQIHFYTLNLFMYPFLIVGCGERRCEHCRNGYDVVAAPVEVAEAGAESGE
jgi:hypothetical protein